MRASADNSEHLAELAEPEKVMATSIRLQRDVL
jgi:hypothetical protein